MGQWIDLETAHGPMRAWQARPDDSTGKPVAGLVVVQEIFGVTAHIRDVADRFARDAGYAVLAPSLFDPVEPGVELPYDPSGAARGMELRSALGFDRAVDLVHAAARRLQDDHLKVGVVGYCWGGSVAFLCNTRLGLPAVSYYGARSVPFLDERARAPMMFHFGEFDGSTPPADIALHREKQPGATIHLYPANHGFNRDASPDIHDPASAELALQRTLTFFAHALR